MIRVKKWVGRILDMPISRKILILVICSVTFFTLGLSLITYQRMAAALEEESSSKMYEALKQINLNIIHYVEQQERQMSEFLSSSDLEISALELKRFIVERKAENDSLIDAKLFADKSGGEENSTVFPLSFIKNHPDAGRFEEQAFVWTNASDQSLNKFAYLPAIYCYAKDTDGEAVWRFDISSDKMFQSVGMSDFGINGAIMVLKENGSLISYSQGIEVVNSHRDILKAISSADSPSGYRHLALNGNEYFISYTRENTLGWYIISAVPRLEVQKSANDLRNYVTVLSVLISLLLIIFLNLSLRLFTNRTKKLSQAVKQFGEGNFDVQFSIGGSKDEIGVLGEQFNEMRRSILNLMEQSKEHYERESALLNENLTLQIMRKEAEYRAMRNQINPHFLYNTLEMIKGLFYQEDSRDMVVDVVQTLSDMFRYNLGKSTTATLGQEIQHIKDYMFIQNARFDEQITLDADIAPQLNDIPVLRFILEPLIENAIKHGFKEFSQNCRIRISAKKINTGLELLVSDNGCGIKPDILETLNAQLESDARPDSERGGIGVYNVNARLKKEYGADYGLHFSSPPGEGATVRILIPDPQKHENNPSKTEMN